jgi:hypothetical protein
MHHNRTHRGFSLLMVSPCYVPNGNHNGMLIGFVISDDMMWVVANAAQDTKLNVQVINATGDTNEGQEE